MNILHHSKRYDFIRDLKDPTFDPFVESYSDHLRELGRIILEIGEPLEGNIFFRHQAASMDTLDPIFLGKRRCLALLASVHSNVVEIGFNAGHSALLMLSANDELRLTSIDLGVHQYTVPCFDYLSKKFGFRNRLIVSDSAQAFPLLGRQESEASLFIIDGGHSLSMAETDLFNCIHFGQRGSVILFDDTDDVGIRILLNMYIAKGLLIPLNDYHGVINNSNQMLFINNKN